MAAVDTAPMWARLSKGECLPSDLGTALYALDTAQAAITRVRALIANPDEIMYVYRDPCEVPAVGVYDVENALDGA